MKGIADLDSDHSHDRLRLVVGTLSSEACALVCMDAANRRVRPDRAFSISLASAHRSILNRWKLSYRVRNPRLNCRVSNRREKLAQVCNDELEFRRCRRSSVMWRCADRGDVAESLGNAPSARQDQLPLTSVRPRSVPRHPARHQQQQWRSAPSPHRFRQRLLYTAPRLVLLREDRLGHSEQPSQGQRRASRLNVEDGHTVLRRKQVVAP